MDDLGQNMATSALWHCLLTLRRSFEVTKLGLPRTFHSGKVPMVSFRNAVSSQLFYQDTETIYHPIQK